MIVNNYHSFYELHCLALGYKEGNAEYGEILVGKFSSFIYNYFSFIDTGYANLNNYSLRSFIKFFYSKSKIQFTQYSLNKHSKNPNVNFKNIINIVKTSMSVEDFKQEVYLALLEMANRYKDTKPTFHIYVQRYFHYVLLERLRKILCYNSFDNISDYEIEDEGFNIYFEKILNDVSNEIELNKAKLKTKKYNSAYSDLFFDDNWYFGNYKDSLFSVLSNDERKLLIDIYINKKRLNDIANERYISRMSVIRRKQKAIDKIKNTLHK